MIDPDFRCFQIVNFSVEIYGSVARNNKISVFVWILGLKSTVTDAGSGLAVRSRSWNKLILTLGGEIRADQFSSLFGHWSELSTWVCLLLLFATSSLNIQRRGLKFVVL